MYPSLDQRMMAFDGEPVAQSDFILAPLNITITGPKSPSALNTCKTVTVLHFSPFSQSFQRYYGCLKI